MLDPDWYTVGLYTTTLTLDVNYYETEWSASPHQIGLGEVQGGSRKE